MSTVLTDSPIDATGPELALVALLLGVALALRPWRLLGRGPLRDPWLATLCVLPVLWALPLWHPAQLQLQWSGACLVELCLGWPLAVPTLALVGLATAVISHAPWGVALDLMFWQGLVPATLISLIGAALRRYAPHHPFVYVLGRGFLGTVVRLFAAALLGLAAGHSLPQVSTELAWVAHWLMAWGDAFITGMMAAIFVAFRPQWLATWSDPLYLQPPAPAAPSVPPGPATQPPSHQPPADPPGP